MKKYTDIKSAIENAKRAEADGKAARREAKKFIETVDQNKQFFLERWGEKVDKTNENLSTKIAEIAEKYGCSIDELLEHISSPVQIEAYQRLRRLNDQSIR